MNLRDIILSSRRTRFSLRSSTFRGEGGVYSCHLVASFNYVPLSLTSFLVFVCKLCGEEVTLRDGVLLLRGPHDGHRSNGIGPGTYDGQSCKAYACANPGRSGSTIRLNSAPAFNFQSCVAVLERSVAA